MLDALETGPDRLVIVSDGWDNAPPGLAGEVLRVWRTRLDPGRRTGVVHLNPVYDADGFRRAPTGPGSADGRDPGRGGPASLVEIARFAEGRTGAAELKAYLDRRVALFPGGRVTRIDLAGLTAGPRAGVGRHPAGAAAA